MPPVRAIERAISILACLGDEDLRLVDLAERVRLHKATVMRLLASLARAGMVSRDEHDRYTLGPGVLRLAARHFAHYRTLADLLRASLRHVNELTRETVTVHVRAGTDRLCIDEIESPQPIAYRAGIGHRAPLYVGSAGKVLLAFLSDAERAAVLRDIRLAPITDRTITSIERLEVELANVRRAGYAVSSGERVVGASAVSVPVLDANGRVLAAVSILAPDARLTPREQARYAVILKREIRPVPPVTPNSLVPEARSPRRPQRRKPRG